MDKGELAKYQWAMKYRMRRDKRQLQEKEAKKKIQERQNDYLEYQKVWKEYTDTMDSVRSNSIHVSYPYVQPPATFSTNTAQIMNPIPAPVCSGPCCNPDSVTVAHNQVTDIIITPGLVIEDGDTMVITPHFEISAEEGVRLKEVIQNMILEETGKIVKVLVITGVDITRLKGNQP